MRALDHERSGRVVDEREERESERAGREQGVVLCKVVRVSMERNGLRVRQDERDKMSETSAKMALGG